MRTRSPAYSPLTVWLLLLVATATSFVAGEFERSERFERFGQAGSLLVALGVLALALLKGSMVALHFMELRQAPALWRWCVLGWLWAVVLGVVVAYLKGMS